MEKPIDEGALRAAITGYNRGHLKRHPDPHRDGDLSADGTYRWDAGARSWARVPDVERRLGGALDAACAVCVESTSAGQGGFCWKCGWHRAAHVDVPTEPSRRTKCGVLSHGANCPNGPCYEDRAAHEVEVSITLCDGLNPGFGYAIRVTRRGAVLLTATRDPVTGEHLNFTAALRVAAMYAPGAAA
jgi:hypothetical protein